MRSSTALLIAWFVVIASLVGAIVFFTLKASGPDETPPDQPHVPVVTERPKPAPPKGSGETRHGSRDPSKGATPPSAPKPLGTIDGIVRGPDAAPVGGARVAIYPATASGDSDAPPEVDRLRQLNSIITSIPPENWGKPRPLAEWTAPGAGTASEVELASAMTKDDGTFAITIPGVVRENSFRLTAAKDGVGSASMAEVSAGQHVQLNLGVASKLPGTVLTAVDSKPVDGARIVLSNGVNRFTAVSGAEGRFEVSGVTPGFYELTVSAKGLTPLFQQNFQVHARDGSPLTLRMPRGSTARIRAVLERVDEEGGRAATPAEEPVKDAEVFLYHEDMCAYAQGRTNAEGFVEFSGLPSGSWVANGLAPGVVSQDDVYFKVDGNQLVVDETIRFDVAKLTEVAVTDEDGRPVPAVEYFAGNNDNAYDVMRSPRLGRGDADGKFKFAFEFTGPRQSIYAFKDGFTVVRAMPDDNESGDPLHLVMKKALTLHGKVTTSEGKPVPDAEVTISVAPAEPDPTNGLDGIDLIVRTGADGTYRFAHLPRMDGISVTAAVDGSMADEDHDIEVVAGKTDYEADFTIDLEPVEEPPQQPAPRPPHGVVPPPKKPLDAPPKPNK